MPGSDSSNLETAGDTTEAPDIDSLRKQLFAFFYRHGNDTVFDTADDSYAIYWGPANYPGYSVQAGHLFNDRQFHAIVFYADERSAGMHIYLREADTWKKIYEDTTLHITGSGSFPVFTDWNLDGTKDISIDETEPNRENQRYALWLVDPQGTAVHKVRAFEEIENPVIDTPAKHIVGSMAHGASLTRSEYAWEGFRLVNLQTVNVGFAGKDSCEIRYFKGNDLLKDVYCPCTEASKHVPSKMRQDVKEYFRR